MGNRQGKHRAEKSSIGLYVDAEFRALLALLVDQTGETATDIIKDGVRNRATAEGILHNGHVAPDFAPVLELFKEALAEQSEARKNRKGGTKSE